MKRGGEVLRGMARGVGCGRGDGRGITGEGMPAHFVGEAVATLGARLGHSVGSMRESRGVEVDA